MKSPWIAFKYAKIAHKNLKSMYVCKYSWKKIKHNFKKNDIYMILGISTATKRSPVCLQYFAVVAPAPQSTPPRGQSRFDTRSLVLSQ